MIDVFVLFVSMYSTSVPIMEFKDEATCKQYAEQYSRSYKTVECKHLMRYDGHFRPKSYGRS